MFLIESKAENKTPLFSEILGGQPGEQKTSWDYISYVSFPQ
jgi:hypothetical protein